MGQNTVCAATLACINKAPGAGPSQDGSFLCVHAGEGVPNANFTQAWLAQNQVTASYAPRFNGAAYIPHACGATPAAPTNGATASAKRHAYQVATA